MTFCTITFGCKVNQCESENVAEAMIKNGFEFEKNTNSAEIIIINSCSVTAESDRKLRQTLHKIKRENQSSIILLTGCMPQADPSAAEKLENIDIIIGNAKKNSIPQAIKNFLKNKSKIIDVTPINKLKVFEKSTVNYSPKRSRAFLKIEDGCNRFCSYCIIPYARGPVRSKPLEEIKYDAENLSKNGYKEIVLVGINLSSYGMDFDANLYDAVKIVSDQENINQVRLSSLERDLMTIDIIKKLSTIPKLCPQFHLSLQSGSNNILKSMRRRYTREEYLNLVNILRKYFKNATFTTDIMVGFPGETENDFEDTLKLITEAKFLKVHVFPYSRRPGTLADKMENQISKNIKSERVKKIIELSNKVTEKVLSEFLNISMPVLYETIDSNGFYEGYTPNYILVKTCSEHDIRGKILETKLESINGNFFKGIIDSNF